jgi:tetratricopeptide (TPR) repeat protein
VAELSADARIRDLERRLDMDPGSRLFVSLAEEYRKLGRFKQALSALQKGLLAHPGYVAAQVALGRVYVEVGQSTDAIATFTKVLVADPGNLVASKSLADIYLARGDKLEALKKLKLCRALSGDRKVDEAITGLEAQVEPRPPTPTRQVKKAPAEPPPAPKFHETDKSRRRSSARPTNQAAAELSDAFEITSLEFHPGDDSGGVASEDPFPFVPTRDTAIASASTSSPAPAAPAPAPPSDAVTPAAPAFETPQAPPIAANQAPPIATSQAPPIAAAAAEPPPAPLPPPVAAPAPPAIHPVLDSPTSPMVLPVPTPPAPESAPASDAVPSTSTSWASSSALDDTSPSPPPVAPRNGDGAEDHARGGDGDDDAIFRAPEDSDAIFGVPPALFQNPEDLAPAAETRSGADGGEAPAAAPLAAPAAPSGRGLADLYYSQGHYAEALQIYDDLVTRHPFDEELMRMRREAEARLLPAGQVHSSAAPDPGVERRRARIRILERFLSRVQAG